MMEQLYRRLLVLSSVTDLGEILRLLAEAARCDVVYLEIEGLAHGHSTDRLPPASLRGRVRDEVMQRAMSERRTVEMTLPADARRWRSEAVALSTPIGTFGALYVEATTPFVTDEKLRFEEIAHHLANGWPSLRGSPRTLAQDLKDFKERRVREAMRRFDGNIAKVARTLGIGRMTVYRICGVSSGDTKPGQVSRATTDRPDMSPDETEIDAEPRSDGEIEIETRDQS